MDNDNELHVVEYKQRDSRQVLLGYYRGFPFSYISSDYEYHFLGEYLKEGYTFSKSIPKVGDIEVIKEKVAGIAEEYKRWIDLNLKLKAQDEAKAKEMAVIFKEVIEGNYVPKQKPVPQEPKKKSFLGRLINS